MQRYSRAAELLIPPKVRRGTWPGCTLLAMLTCWSVRLSAQSDDGGATIERVVVDKRGECSRRYVVWIACVSGNWPRLQLGLETMAEGGAALPFLFLWCNILDVFGAKEWPLLLTNIIKPGFWTAGTFRRISL